MGTRSAVGRGRRRASLCFGTVSLACLTLFAATTSAQSNRSDTFGHTTVEQRISPTPNAGFRTLQLGAGEPYVVREEGIGDAKQGRADRRRSLLYFGQLSDFQLADEESPARVEFVDVVGPPFEAAWRPWEALNPQLDEAMIRQVNAFAEQSPVAGGDGSRARMKFTIGTGDLADSQQLNETLWVRTLLEGGRLDPNTGIDPAGYSHSLCPPGLAPGGSEANGYTGVQDYDDYLEGPIAAYWDPDDPRGAFNHFPEYPGLMDRAQQAFDASGLDVPSYVVFGNHDALVQGNAAANAGYEQVSTGCIKPMVPVGDTSTLSGALATLDPLELLGMLATEPQNLAVVPPDPLRQFVSKKQYMDVFRSGSDSEGHGFTYVSEQERAASGGAAGYYAWTAAPGFRFIGLDTVADGGLVGIAANGNIDHPQYEWLVGELEAATRKDQLVFLFSHHGPMSLTAPIPDEVAGPCTSMDAHAHDINPGCDVDPRSSSPVHTEDDMVELLHRYPHVVSWVAGHSHVNDATPYPDSDGSGGFWAVRVAAEADWPQQSRLLEIFDNADGTLSLFGTILDQASDATAPASGTPAAGMSTLDLASVARTISYNDTQVGARVCTPACGEGLARDRNIELLIDDPRRTPGSADSGGRCRGRIRGTARNDNLRGTASSEIVVGRKGNDRISALRGNDCIRGNSGRDRLSGGPGTDRIKGGTGNDRIFAQDGQRDIIACGKGRDRVRADHVDVLRRCERRVVR